MRRAVFLVVTLLLVALSGLLLPMLLGTSKYSLDSFQTGKVQTANFSYDNTPEGQQKFIKEMASKFGQDASVLEGLGPETLSIIASELEKSGGNLDNDTIAKGLKFLKEYQEGGGGRGLNPSDLSGSSLESLRNKLRSRDGR